MTWETTAECGLRLSKKRKELMKMIVEGVTIIGLRSAKMNSEIAEQEQERQALEREIARIKHENEMDAEFPTILSRLMEKVDEQAEKGYKGFHYLWTEEMRVGLCRIGYNRFLEHYKRIKPILEELGYRTDIHTYSSSWRNKSGKIAELHIYWYEN